MKAQIPYGQQKGVKKGGGGMGKEGEAFFLVYEVFFCCFFVFFFAFCFVFWDVLFSKKK